MAKNIGSHYQPEPGLFIVNKNIPNYMRLKKNVAIITYTE